jgi:hypothetical protein
MLRNIDSAETRCFCKTLDPTWSEFYWIALDIPYFQVIITK